MISLIHFFCSLGSLSTALHTYISCSSILSLKFIIPAGEHRLIFVNARFWINPLEHLLYQLNRLWIIKLSINFQSGQDKNFSHILGLLVRVLT